MTACTASGPTFCTIDPTGQDQITVTTSFTLDNHILDVTDDTDGNVTGFVVSPIFGPGPEIIDCGDNSEPQEKCGPPAVPFGTVFQLTATPDTGFTFDHWSTVPLTVCDGLTKTTCTFNLTADTQVTPHYRSIPLESINVTISPSSPIEDR